MAGRADSPASGDRDEFDPEEADGDDGPLAWRESLVLSAGFVPLARVTWQRVMGMWVSGRVEVIESYDDVLVRTVSDQFPLPSIVRFAHASAWRRSFIRFSRDNVYVRDKGRCQYCFQTVTRKRATWDHVLPRSREGRTSWDNVVLACRRCNQVKGDRTPEEAGMRLRSTPVRPRSLPSLADGSLAFRDGMPESWRPYLRSLS